MKEPSKIEKTYTILNVVLLSFFLIGLLGKFGCNGMTLWPDSPMELLCLPMVLLMLLGTSRIWMQLRDPATTAPLATCLKGKLVASIFAFGSVCLLFGLGIPLSIYSFPAAIICIGIAMLIFAISDLRLLRATARKSTAIVIVSVVRIVMGSIMILAILDQLLLPVDRPDPDAQEHASHGP